MGVLMKRRLKNKQFSGLQRMSSWPKLAGLSDLLISSTCRYQLLPSDTLLWPPWLPPCPSSADMSRDSILDSCLSPHLILRSNSHLSAGDPQIPMSPVLSPEHQSPVTSCPPRTSAWEPIGSPTINSCQNFFRLRAPTLSCPARKLWSHARTVPPTSHPL